jgi:hypothetical protein
MANEDDAVIEPENWQKAPEKPLTPVTVQQLEQMIAQAYKEQAEVDKIEGELAEANKKLTNSKLRILAVFQEFDKSSYRYGSGTVVRQKRFTVQMPKSGDPARDKFFAYLNEKKAFDALITVHSATLNKFYKEQMEAARDAGEGADFTIPGLQPPKMVEQISLRRR